MSNNQQTLTVVGGIVGGVLTEGSPYGIAAGEAIGGYWGASLDQLPDIRGPKLEDRKIQLSSYGIPRPLAYGPNIRVAGNEIWRLGNALTEVPNTDDTFARVVEDTLTVPETMSDSPGTVLTCSSAFAQRSSARCRC